MTKATMIWTLVIAGTAAAVSPAVAQATLSGLQNGFVNIEAGAQPQRRSVDASSTFPLYDEVATVTSSQRIRNGMVFGASGGVRIYPSLAIGAGFTSFGRPGTGVVTASIPDPVFFGRSKTVVVDAADLEHRETAINVQASFFVPVTDSIDVTVSAGPSVIRVKQGLIAGGTVAPGTQNLIVAQTVESGNAVGFNAGFDVNYLLSSRFGVGLFVRYTGGSVDLPSITNFKVGGVQSGLGVRARF